MGLQRLIIYGLEEATPFLVSASATLGESIALWNHQQDDLLDDDIVFQEEKSGREVFPNDLVESLMGGKNKELKLLAYQREVTIVHNGIIEDCDGAPTLQGIVQNFAKMNKLDASDYSLLLQRRPLRYLLRKKIEVTVRLNDSTIRTVLMDIDDPITNALEATESGITNRTKRRKKFALGLPPIAGGLATTTSIPWWNMEAMHLNSNKFLTIRARADVALRKIMNTWCAAKRIAARFWTEEGEVAHERLKVSDISGPLKVEVMSDKVLFTITAHNDGKKSISRIRGNSMHPVQSVMEKWCELQGLSIDDCRFEWSELILTGIEFPAFLGMEDEEEMDVFPSGTTPRMLKSQTADAHTATSSSNGHTVTMGLDARPATRGSRKAIVAAKTRAWGSSSNTKAKTTRIKKDWEKNVTAKSKARVAPKAKGDKRMPPGKRLKKKASDPASSNKEDEAPQKTSGRRSGGVLQDLISPMPIKVGVTRAGKKTPVEKPRIPGEIAPGVENIPGKKSFVSGQVTPGAVDISRKRVRRRSSVDLSEDKDEKHMTYDEWEKWDMQEEIRIKRLRKQPTVQEQINVAVALSLSEVTAQERQ
eukprot:GEMP01023433.1.p1 GENE.GEMP01023433.1~~GEMP01023433.1.p1  ORF type:complete len:590 (+),score=125.42 GEMP01023433.1:109-1878(+)